MSYVLFKPLLNAAGWLIGFEPGAGIQAPTVQEALLIAKRAGWPAPIIGEWPRGLLINDVKNRP